MEDFLNGIPENIINELSVYGFRIAMKGSSNIGLKHVISNEFPQKENKEAIKELKALGWRIVRSKFKDGIKYTSLTKDF